MTESDDATRLSGTRISELAELMSRPDRDLPPQLRHEKIRKVRDVSAYNNWAYQIVFDQHYLPYSYWNPKPDAWEMKYARVEWHNRTDGLLGKLLPKQECITIVVEYQDELSLRAEDA